mgnify:CR=1 FL=1|tara:strand:+ start:264 stop:446 length:183 start_codon:yes stop_codon:yes gene_type:complete
MKAKTPYRRLQERVKELEEISKVHQEQNGKLQVEISKKDKQIEELEGELYQCYYYLGIQV